jgi:hypothetical protein
MNAPVRRPIARKRQFNINRQQSQHAAAVVSINRGISREEKKTKALALIRSRLKAPSIARVIKRGKTDSDYEFELEDGTLVKLGKADALDNPRRTKAALFDALGIVVEVVERKKWLAIKLAIANASEIIETSTEAEETLAWLHAFVSRSSLRGSDQTYLTESLPKIDYNDKQKLFDVLRSIRSSSNASGGSYHSVKGFFDYDDRCYLQITAFERFINFNALSTERMTAPKLSMRLTRLGFSKVEVAARQGEKVMSVRMYASPAKFFDDSIKQ